MNASRRANLRLAGALASVVLLMVGAAYAAVPLYQLFCQVTGYGGTPRRATAEAGTVLDRTVTIRFDANVAGLPWEFRPKQADVRVKVGETAIVAYLARNLGPQPTAGTATFNVTPDVAGRYFNKIECFCFARRELAPGESAELPVTFFIDPAIAEDRDLDPVRTITLSYTFYPSQDAGQPVAQRAEDAPDESL